QFMRPGKQRYGGPIPVHTTYPPTNSSPMKARSISELNLVRFVDRPIILPLAESSFRVLSLNSEITMHAKSLARILGLLCQNSDVSHGIPQEFEERFKSLRGYGRLPRGRERREEKLSNEHTAAAVFGLVPIHPSWAGHGAIILAGLRPVGGTEASF